MHPSIPRLAEALTDLLKQPLGADPPTRAAVLGWVNHARRAINLLPLNQLPKGIPGDVGRCPLAEAVPGHDVAADSGGVGDRGPSPLPAEFAG